MRINLELIKSKRETMNYTIDEMAKFIGLTNGSMYWKRENGNYKFKTNELPILSKVLDIPFANLYSSDEYSKMEIGESETCDSPNKTA